ncbi:MAG TPA: class I SAM-dependent methyltransferase [Phycisphaerae bacterium]|nr:class I SAM-dependent methyltransferase [Phycisphaerae bacterium]
MKSTVDEIRERFDHEVERFSNLETGQAATMDARLCMELVAQAAACVTPHARDLLDVGCGAGNYTLMMLRQIPRLNCTLVDLSLPMLEKARERVTAAGAGTIETMQGDMREAALGEERFDVVVSAATLHHLRTDAEWRAMFEKVYRALRPGGSFWVFDLIEHATPELQNMMWARYGEFLVNIKGGGAAGQNYRDAVFAYVAKEDTPRSLLFQTALMHAAGFTGVDVLHKNGPFAAFGGVKR